MAIVLMPGFTLDADLRSDVIGDLAPFGPIGFSMGGYLARAIQGSALEYVKRLVPIATSARGDTEVQAQRKAAVTEVDRQRSVA